jgi:hypothetical protein
MFSILLGLGTWYTQVDEEMVSYWDKGGGWVAKH